MKTFHVIREPSKPFRKGSDREAAWSIAKAYSGCAVDDVVEAWAHMERARRSGGNPGGWIGFFCGPSKRRSGTKGEVLAEIIDSQESIAASASVDSDSPPGSLDRQSLDISALQDFLRGFAKERDWEQFHSPKNLAMALSVEAAELVEIFQWLTEAQSADLDDETRAAAAAEIADIQIYLARLADRLNIDIPEAVGDKLVRNARKYPAHEVRGSAVKRSGP